MTADGVAAYVTAYTSGTQLTVLPQNCTIVYSSSTATQSGTNTVTLTSGSGWTTAFLGLTFVFANGNYGNITSIISGSSLTLDQVYTSATQSYYIVSNGPGCLSAVTSAPSQQLFQAATTAWANIMQGSNVTFANGVTSQIATVSGGAYLTSLQSRIVVPQTYSIVGVPGSWNWITAGAQTQWLPASCANAVVYNVGLITQAGTTATGSGTWFTASLIGATILYANGMTATITGFTSITVMTVTPSQTVSSQSYAILSSSSCISTVTALVQPVTPLACVANLYSSGTASQVNYTVYGVYTSAGTASQSGTTVTCTNTVFVAANVGAIITWTTGQTATVTAYISSTQLTVTPSQTVASGTYALSTTWTSALVGTTIVYNNNNGLIVGNALITGFINAGTLTAWTSQNVASQSYTTLPGQAPATPQCIATAAAFVYAGGYSWYSYKARVHFSFPTNNAGYIGLAAMYQDTNNHYEVYTTGSGQLMLRKKVNGTYTNFWSSSYQSMTLGFGQWYDLELEVRYGRLRVWFQGQLVGRAAYDTTFQTGTVAITAGTSPIRPYWDYITVQQQCAYSKLTNGRADMRVYSNSGTSSGVASHTFYVNGVAQQWAGSTIVQSTISTGEWVIPYVRGQTLALTANVTGTGTPGLQLRAPWMGLDTTGVASWTTASTSWVCSPGFDQRWTQPGYNLYGAEAVAAGAAFAPAVATGSQRQLQGLFYSTLDTSAGVANSIGPAYIWTANWASSGDPTVTCVLPSMQPLSSEPTVQTTNLPQMSTAPAGPAPYDWNNWQRIDAPGTVINGNSVTSAWNYVTSPQQGSRQPSAGNVAVPNGYISFDTASNAGTFLYNADLSGVGTYQVYRFGWGLSSYQFSTNFNSNPASIAGVVWQFQDATQYYEYYIDYNNNYHAVRKHVAGVASTLFIGPYYGLNNQANTWVSVSILVSNSTTTLIANGTTLLNNVALDPTLLTGTFGYQSVSTTASNGGGNSLFYNTSINFYVPQNGPSIYGSNPGLWLHSNVFQLDPLGSVLESSGGGLTFYKHNSWTNAWSYPNAPGASNVTNQRLDWVARVAVAISAGSPPSQTGSMGLAFYMQDSSNYFELVMATSLNSVALNQRQSGGVVKTLCSASVQLSSNMYQTRQLQIRSRGGVFSIWVDAVFVKTCPASTMVDPTNSSIPLSQQGPIALLSNVTGPQGYTTVRFTDLNYQWIPFATNDTGPCGTALCAGTCLNGGTCTSAALVWGSVVCSCPPAWTSLTCGTALDLSESKSTVTGNGTTGGPVGSTLSLTITALTASSAAATVDANYASNINVTVVYTNLFKFVVQTLTPTVVRVGTSNVFTTSFPVQYTGNGTVYVSWNPSGLSIASSPYTFTVATAGAVASGYLASGSGVTGTTVNVSSPINLIAQDASGNEVLGSAATASTISVSVSLAGSSTPFPVSLTYTGLGGRYTGSYVPTVAGQANVAITVGGVPINGSVFQPQVYPLPILKVISPSTANTPVYFSWVTSSQGLASAQKIVGYKWFISEESKFVSLTSSQFSPTAPGASLSNYYAVVLNPSQTYYFQVQVLLQDPFTQAVTSLPMSAQDYLFHY